MKNDELICKCTGAYVGKKACVEGTPLIARSEDQQRGAYRKLFKVSEATDNGPGFIYDTGFAQNSFKVEVPNKQFKFTYVPDSAYYKDGMYYACCTNEFGLAVIGTVSTSVSEEYAQIDPLKPAGEGIREAILPAIPAVQCKNSIEAVKTLAAYLDRYGSAECNTVFFSDAESDMWIFEIYGGYTYAAVRMPEDCIAVFGNQIMLGFTDFSDKNNVIISPKLIGCLNKLNNIVKDCEGRVHLAMSIDNRKPRNILSQLRTYRGAQLFSPETAGEFDENKFYPLFFKPDRKVSVIDIMKLFGDRYEGSIFEKDGDFSKSGLYYDEIYPIGIMRQGDVHIIQTFENLPADTCQLQWLALGNAEGSVFVPAFSGITDTFSKYKIDNKNVETADGSYYFVCKKICALLASDRKTYSSIVKEFNLKEEKKMLSKILKSLPEINNAYLGGISEGRAFVTALSEKFAKNEYKKAIKLFDKLMFMFIDRANDR